MAKDFKIETIANNIFSKVDINEKENAKQWESDKETFEDELSKVVKGLDNDQRDIVLSKLEKLSHTPEGFFNSNGSINVKKFIKTTKDIVSKEEAKIKSSKSDNDRNYKNENVNYKITEEKQLEAKLKQIEQEAEPYIDKWSDEEKKTYKVLIRKTEEKYQKIQKLKAKYIKSRNG